jgi:alginate O-acetyltransferase complex protein AlgI
LLFDSLEFLLFLPIVLIAYQVLKGHRRFVLLLASYFFYGWWNWYYLLLILGSTVVDFIISNKLSVTDEVKKRKLLLGLSLTYNLSILFFFKYFNFVNHQVNDLFSALGMNYLIPYSKFLLPMGISFYTFQTIAYTVDVYRKNIEAEKDFFNYALFVSFFPQLVAGPIERAGNLLGQLKKNQSIVIQNFTTGFGRILFGVFKKVVIANRLGAFVNQIYDDPYTYDGSMLLLATVFFAFQIYCDFSAYSDIAIGCAKVLGVDLMENFRSPYFARNIKEFWARWHISLSTWFKDYVYIPLGGNKNYLYRNLLIVFLVSGLWHGASINFLIWGFVHAILIIATQFILNKITLSKSTILKWIGIVTTFVFVNIAWVFFRAKNVEDAFWILSNFDTIQLSYVKDILYQIKMTLSMPYKLGDALNLDYGRINFQLSILDFIVCIVSIPALVLFEYYLADKILSFSSTKNRTFLHLAGLIVLILLFGKFTAVQFIYFQF